MVIRPHIERRPEVQARAGISRSTLYAQTSQGLWPKSLKIAARAVGWPSKEVDAVIEARIAGKTDEEIRLLVKNLEVARGKAGGV